MSVLCRVCHGFPPLVSIFGLFPVLVNILFCVFLDPPSCVHRGRRQDHNCKLRPCLSVPRLTQARCSREIDAAIRGSSRPIVRGRSTLPSAAHPGPPFVGDRRRRAWLPQAHHSREIDDAILGSPKPAGRHPNFGQECRSQFQWIQFPNFSQECRSQVPCIQFPNFCQECRSQVLWIQFPNFGQECHSQVPWIQSTLRPGVPF